MSALSDKQFKIKVKQRGTIRASVTKDINKIPGLFQQTPPDVESAKIVSGQLHRAEQLLKELDEIIVENINEDQLDQEIQKAEEYRVNIATGISATEIRLKALESAATPPSPSPSSLTAKDLSLKLPKLEIPKYNGDPLHWDEFWDNFDSSIHQREDLPPTDKFKYLKSFLEGEALRIADGYRLTIANYEQVVQALKERFGDPELATFSHFEALINLKPASYDLPELREVLDKCESHIRSLVALGLPESTFGVVFTPLILSKLPKGVKIEMHRKNGSQTWRLENLRRLLKDEISAREKGERVFASTNEYPKEKKKGHQDQQQGRQNKSHHITTSTLAADASALRKPNSPPKCAFCSGSHFSSSCDVYPDVDSRLKQIQGQCHACLRSGHRAPQCRSKRPCYFCRRDSHHQSLCRQHLEKKAPAKQSSTVASAPESSTSNLASTSSVRPASNLSIQTPNCESILQTAVANVKGTSGQATARFYFDTGGSRSFITRSLAHKIGAKYVGEESVSVGRFRDSKRSTVTYKIFEFDVCLPDGKSKRVRMSAENIISCPIQLIPLDPRCPVVSSVKLAEPLVSRPTSVSIDILVGNDYYYCFIGQDQLRCANGVVLLSSPFGFVAGGSISAPVKGRNYESSFFIDTTRLDNPLQSIERFWSLENIGIKDDSSQMDDDKAMSLFNKSVQFEDSRYMVKWPWKDEHPEIEDDYGLAFGRLKSLVNRIKSDPDLVAAYDKNISDQKILGIIEAAPTKPDGVVRYIPHQCVINPEKKTTKLRIVYDASAKSSKDQRSINECLHRGPIFLADSVGLLIRWRLPNIAIISDIEKAFLQVGLQLPDRDITRFLWLKDIAKPISPGNIEVLRFCRVPFGFVSSPFLLAATILHHLRQQSDPVSSGIAGNVYVDNVFGAALSPDDAAAYYKSAKRIFAKASMNLREWSSNSQEFINLIPEVDRGTASTTSVLGLKWNMKDDTFSLSTGISNRQQVTWTKRQILQHVASIFDPCGLLCPITIKGKLIMQELWKSKCGWDDELPEAIKRPWSDYLADAAQIPHISFRRQLHGCFNAAKSTFELHCYCDASSRAYAAAIYLRIVTPSKISCTLVFSKNRVAPVKTITIPRLELIAIVIGVRAIQFVASQLHLPIAKKYVWSDSACALHWIKGNQVSTVFVQNRVREIRHHTDIDFRFIPSKDNPADLPSRGVTTSDVLSSQLWWAGPRWLCDNTMVWPHMPEAFNESDVFATQPASVQIETASVAGDYLLDPGKFCSLSRLMRITAYVMRAIRLFQNKDAAAGILSIREMEDAKRIWDKQVQQNELSSLFSPGFQLLSSNLQDQLGLFLDSAGLVRCRGRYKNSCEADEMQYPKLLPKNSHYTDLIIKQCHEKLMHAGVKHTLAQLRLEYWPIHARNQIKRVLRRCYICKYYSGRHFRTPKAASLPEFRTKMLAPFHITGLDYLGPLLIKDPSKTAMTKTWICLFTCATVRAIHLEVVQSLTTEQFLLCLRRFIATYGQPALLISDNAKQFHSAAKALSKIWNQLLHSPEVKTFSRQQKIDWKFITELAPWMGGFYERMVGIVKTALKKSIHQSSLTLIELQTVVCEITAVVNSRPLLYNEDDVNEDIITPNHFLQRRSQNIILPSTEEEYLPQPVSADALITNWKRIQAMLDVFWKSWQTSYLQSLQQYIWKPANRGASDLQPKKGTVVVIKDSSFRGCWKLGVITDLIASHDNIVRTAVVRLACGKLLRRPLKLLYPLESGIDPVGFSASISKNSGDLKKKLSGDKSDRRRQQPPRAAAIAARCKLQNFGSSEREED